jgi:hypothetical protein
MSLRAPIAVPVEVKGPGRRVFRLAANVGVDGILLERSLPFESGRPVDVRFTLPDDPERETLRAVVRAGADQGAGGPSGESEHAGGNKQASQRASELLFVDPPSAARQRISRYVASRLGLPPLPGLS